MIAAILNDGHKKRGLTTTFKMPTSYPAMFFMPCYVSGALLST
jgi:hypothetical protein